MTKDSNQQWVLLGRIARPHGVKGALSVKLDNPDSETLRPGINIRLQKENKAPTYFEVEFFHAGRILGLKDLTDRNVAEKLVGSSVYVSREDFPAIDADEIYLGDMLGFEVFAVDGTKVGTVEGFSDNSAQTIIEVRSPSKVLGSIPFVKPLIVEIDLKSRKLVVDLPQGLFDKD